MSSESQSFDPYEAVLADLRAKRAQIDQAIQVIESVRGTGATTAAAISSPAPSNDTLDGPGAFLGMSIADATKKLLASRKQALGNADILAALKAGGMALTSTDPINTVGSVLTRRFNQVGDIVKVGRGVWGLKEWYPGRSFARKEGSKEETDEPKSAAIVPPLDAAETTASVPFMITQAQKARLRELGQTDEQIRHMTPKEAQDYIDLFA